MSCRFCGNTNTEVTEVEFKDGSKHLKEFCNPCSKWIGWVPQNKDPREFVMPIGKHNGKTLQKILEDDFDYLLWASENLPLNIRKKICNILNFPPPT